MRETITSADQKLTWYLRSLADHDTHHGALREDGTVLARCRASFTPRPTLKVIGPPPGQLITGDLALRETCQIQTRCASNANMVMTGERIKTTEEQGFGIPLTRRTVGQPPVLLHTRIPGTPPSSRFYAQKNRGGSRQ